MVTVAIVDDDSTIRQMLRDILDLEGMNVIGVAESSQVVQVARGTKVDVFLIDLMLQKSCGIEVAQELRNNGFGAPILGMSGSPFLAELAHESGLFAGVVEKPFEIDELLLALTELAAVEVGGRAGA